MNKIECLYNVLGWQGGTIHQVADELGIAVGSLLHGTFTQQHIGADHDYMKGQYAYSSCSTEWVRERLVPMYRGNLDFWLGYMRAYALDKY